MGWLCLLISNTILTTSRLRISAKINESCDHVYHAAKCQFVINVSFEVKIEYDAKAFSKATSKKIAIHPSRFRHLRHCQNLHGIEKEKLRGNLMPGSSDLSVRETLSIALLQSGDARMNIALVSGICSIDPTTKMHYPIDTTQQRSWANYCEAGRALVTQPNVKLIDLWRIGNGQMNRR
jgi:hypothetical protein